MPSLSVNNSNNRFTLTLTVTETGTSVANNTSTCSWSLDLKANTAYNFTTYAIGYSVTLNGVSVGYRARADRVQYSIADYGTVNIASGSGVVIKHADDGSLVMPVSFGIDMASADYTPGTLSYSSTMTLSKLARYSTLNVANGTLGVTQTITVTQQSTGSKHTIKWVCGTAKGDICTNSSATSFTFTPDISLAAQNTTGSSVVINFTITTVGVGDKPASATYAIPDSVKPSVTLDIADAAGHFATYGAYVQGYSKLTLTANTTLAHGSPIKTYEITADGQSYTTSPVTTSVLQNTGKIPVTAVVTDYRSRPSTKFSTEITVLKYEKPVVEVVAYRCTTDGTSDPEGSCMRVGFNASITSLNGKNTATYTITYRPNGGSDTTITGSGTSYLSDAIACDTTKIWEIEVTVADNLSSSPKAAVIPIAFTLMEFYKTGRGVSFGKIATQDGFDCAMDAYFSGTTSVSGSLTSAGAFTSSGGATFSGALTASGTTAMPAGMTIGGKTILNLIYPVGSIYMSVSSTSPATFLGGTWERIQDKFLLSAGSSYVAGATGGRATVALTVAEMPSHKHGIEVCNGSASGSDYFKVTFTQGGTYKVYNTPGQLTGGGAAHENMPPYLAVYVWKRTA